MTWVSSADLQHVFCLIFLFNVSSKTALIEGELFSKALDLAALSTEHSQYKDWWWKVQIGKCYLR